MDFSVGYYEFIENLRNRFPEYSRETLQEYVNEHGMSGAFQTLCAKPPQKPVVLQDHENQEANNEEEEEEQHQNFFSEEDYEVDSDSDDSENEQNDFVWKNVQKFMKNNNKNNNNISNNICNGYFNGQVKNINNNSVNSNINNNNNNNNNNNVNSSINNNNNYYYNNDSNHQNSRAQNINTNNFCVNNYNHQSNKNRNINENFNSDDFSNEIQVENNNNNYDNNNSQNDYNMQQYSQEFLQNGNDADSIGWGSINDQQQQNNQQINYQQQAVQQSCNTINTTKGKPWKGNLRSNIYSDLNYNNSNLLEQDMWHTYENQQQELKLQQQSQYQNNNNNNSQNKNVVAEFFEGSEEQEDDEEENFLGGGFQHLTSQQIKKATEKNSVNFQNMGQQINNNGVDNNIALLRSIFPFETVGNIEFTLARFKNDTILAIKSLQEKTINQNNNNNNNIDNNQQNTGKDKQTLVQDLLREIDQEQQNQEILMEEQIQKQSIEQEQQQFIDTEYEQEEEIGAGSGIVGCNNKYQNNVYNNNNSNNINNIINSTSYNNSYDNSTQQQQWQYQQNNNSYNNSTQQQQQQYQHNNGSYYVSVQQQQQQYQQNNNFSYQIQNQNQHEQDSIRERIPYEQQFHNAWIFRNVMDILHSFQEVNPSTNSKLEAYFVHNILMQQNQNIYKTKRELQKMGFQPKKDKQLIQEKKQHVNILQQNSEQTPGTFDLFDIRKPAFELYKRAKDLKKQAHEFAKIRDFKNSEQFRKDSLILKYESEKQMKHSVDLIKWHFNKERVQQLFVDLHGLTKDEAIQWMEEIHALAMQMMKVFVMPPKVSVVTGKGRHSPDQEPKIKNKVLEWAEEKGLFVVEHEGSLDILYGER